VDWSLARIRVLVALLLWLAEALAEPATTAHLVSVGYVGASVAALAFLWHARGPLPNLLMPVVDLVTGALVTRFSSLSAVHFFPLFVLVSIAYRAGVVPTIISGAILAGVLAVETEPHFSGLPDVPLLRSHLVVLSGYTIVAAALIGHLARRERGARSESAAIGRLFEHLRLDDGPVLSVRTILEQLRVAFGARQVVLAVDETEDGLALVWRSRDAVGASGHQRVVSRLRPDERRPYWFPAASLTAACLLTRIGRRIRVAAAVNDEGDVVTASGASAEAFFDACSARRVFLLPHLTIGTFRLRLFVLDPHVERADEELRLLQTLARRVMPVVHNLYLERHLRRRLREDERARLARELHDGVIQSLIAIEMRLDVARRQVGSAPAAAVSDLGDAQQQLREQIVDVRTLMNQLRPPEVARRRLMDQLTETTERFRRTTGIETNFVRGVERLDVPSRVCGELVRVVDEALMNVRKHSGAHRVDVRLGQSPGAVTLSIEDDGRGFGFDGRMTQPDLDASGMGPLVIKERVSALGGLVAIDSQSCRGTRLEVQVPRPVLG